MSPPPPLAEEEEDPDPFRQSLLPEDEDEDSEPPPEVMTQPLQIRKDSRGTPLASPPVHSGSPRSAVTFTQQQMFGHGRRASGGVPVGAGVGIGTSPSIAARSPPTQRMMTSAELNMKSHILDPSRRGPASVDSDSDEEDELHRTGGPLMAAMGMGASQSYAVSSEMEQGLAGSLQLSSRRMDMSQGRGGSAVMEESDEMYPGSGFFK